MARTKGSKNRIGTPGVLPGLNAMIGMVGDAMLKAGVEASGGLVPVVYLMTVMGDKDVPRAERMAAATTLMPYYHKRRPVEVDIDVTQSDMVAQQLELVYGIDEGAEVGADSSELH